MKFFAFSLLFEAMKILDYTTSDFFRQLAAATSAEASSAEIAKIAADVIANVRQNGDRAVEELTEKFDGVKISAKDFRVSKAEFDAALAQVSDADKQAMRKAIECVAFFNEHSKPKNWTAVNPQGAKVGEMFYPIERVGIYIPGGQAPLVSTVVMTVTLAKIAGCPEICVCTPPAKDGRVNPSVLAVLSLLGVDEVYKIGGSQAIAAMGVGTHTVKAVDKLYGPGNAFVIAAKRELFGEVGVDLLPGPSEVLIVADDTANPKFVAADLLSQAEHGSGREKIYFIATSQKMVDAVSAELSALEPKYTRAAKLMKIIENNYVVVLVPDVAAAAEVANFIAPEHMELQIANAQKHVPEFKTAGAVLVGALTPTVLGDFTAGPSHTLPTGRTGRFSGGLQVVDFMRRSSYVEYGKESLANARGVVSAFAKMESLDAHGGSLSIRL